jgi:general L-amino acid transport system permease protein
MPPPSIPPLSLWNWAQKRLFNTWYNTVLTIAALLAIGLSFKGFLVWAATQAQWAVIGTNLKVFLAGRFPHPSLWRLWAIAAIVTLLGSLTWGRLQPQDGPHPSRVQSEFMVAAGSVMLMALVPISLASRLGAIGLLLLLLVAGWLGRSFPVQRDRWLAVAWLLSLPLIFWLLRGGWGLQAVPPYDWSGLLLTLLVTVISMALAFPLGILLALGRQSSWPIVRLFSTLYIEVLRGLPLIGVLFIALILLPLLLPPDWQPPGLLLRGLAGLILFNAAYMAEVVRGGLQAVPKEQLEAARALGLNPLLVINLVLLPQALRAVIPALVGEFVSLFKETALLSVFGLIELLGISTSILANPEYIGRYAEVYLFVGAVYWIFCYGMSIVGQRLEQKDKGFSWITYYDRRN